ncbi:MAG: hypothetical protein AB3N28_05040 [Kordiimonas sp.]
MKFACSIFIAATLAVTPSALAQSDGDKTRFESSGFLQSLDAFIAEQMTKQRTGQKDLKPGSIEELELSLRDNKTSGNSMFRLSDSRNLKKSSSENLSSHPDFSSLLAPTGQVRGSYGQDLFGANTSLDLSFGGDKTDPNDRGFEVSLQSAYRYSVQGLPALTGFADTGVADKEYNVGVTLGYAGFGVDASFTRQTSLFENELQGYDVGLSYRSNSWAARLSMSGYREGADLYGIENDVRSIVSVELGASYRLTHNLGLSGGVRYYDYGDQWLQNPEKGENSQMIFLGGRLNF